MNIKIAAKTFFSYNLSYSRERTVGLITRNVMSQPGARMIRVIARGQFNRIICHITGLWSCPAAHDPEKPFKRRLRWFEMLKCFTVSALVRSMIAPASDPSFLLVPPYHHVSRAEKIFQDMLRTLSILIYQPTAILLVRRILQSSVAIIGCLERAALANH